MSEKYYLPVLYTEEERKKYAEWGIKKEKWMGPFTVISIIIYLVVSSGTVAVLWKIREKEPYFSAFMSAYGNYIIDIAEGIAVILVIIVFKPLDAILDFYYKKPEEPKMICLTPTEYGVRYMLMHREGAIAVGTYNWNEWENAISVETNEIHIDDIVYKIGYNTIESIYPKNKQNPWMDRPKERVENVIDLKVISRNFQLYLLSLEEKKKEQEWLISHVE